MRRKIQKAGLILSLTCLAVAVVMIPLNPPGSMGRIVMTGVAVVGILTSLSFIMQLRQKKP
jgi:heme/copper-type cytochrome/quinol oxidase subunit 4